ncbi:interference hedgehog [Nephila pilipes]|uniref:Interference hedgehog n=1 Tax=Nephila pilipes TaxID=299642 RepID=A0A8X6QUA3_NEPPI|nr:interference hedgehog [Nephila pilipes]
MPCPFRSVKHPLISLRCRLKLSRPPNALRPFPPPHIDLQLSAIAGNTVVIPCDPPYSVPTVITEFIFKHSIIARSTERKHLMLSGDLQIFDVNHEDSGEYTCVATNPFLAENVTSQRKVILSVIESTVPKPVEIIRSPRPKVSVALGRNITLECAAVGYPTPVITWRKLQGKLPHNRYQQFGGNLHLISVMQADEGTYECEADNSHGIKEVRRTDLEIQETPKILKPLKNVNLETGSNLTLNCPVRGYPKPILKWLHNGKEIISDAKKSFLIVSNIGPKHAGVYQCFATNSLGTSYDSAVVTVTSGNISMGYDDELDYDDYDLNGTPLPNNDKEFTSLDQNFDGEDGRKDTSPSLDSKSNGKKGRKKKPSKGVKLIPPSKPEITRLSNSSVMVRWSAGQGGLPINFFKVQYKEVGKRKTDWMTIDEDIAAHIHSYAVINLRTGGAYRFRLAAVYSNHDNKAGPISDKFVLYKDPPIEKPSIGPIITCAEAVSPSAIALYWEYDDIDYITVEGFFIHYRATHTAGKYLKVTVLGANTRSHIISHLLPETGYDIKMQCFNIAGTSEFSNIYTSKTKVAENYIANRNRNGKPHYDDDINTSFTETASSKNSMSSGHLTIAIGVVVSLLLMLILTVVCYFLLCKRQNENRGHENGSDRENQLKTANGHVSSNGYMPVNSKININVNPLSHLNIDGTEKLEELQDIVSNNNEIIPLQTFNTNQQPQEEPLLTDGERESNLNESIKAITVISPGKPHTSADSPTEL